MTYLATVRFFMSGNKMKEYTNELSTWEEAYHWAVVKSTHFDYDNEYSITIDPISGAKNVRNYSQ